MLPLLPALWLTGWRVGKGGPSTWLCGFQAVRISACLGWAWGGGLTEGAGAEGSGTPFPANWAFPQLLLPCVGGAVQPDVKGNTL